MPFLRLTRDSRGYEYTFLLHASHPGEEPRVLYWYRSAPGVRVGRPPLDEDAIHAIEERHPEIEFDWPQIIEVGATLPPEVERRPERPRRRPVRPPDEPLVELATRPGPPAPPPPDAPGAPSPAAQLPAEEELELPGPLDASRVLDDLVGREIATRLRERYADLVMRLRAMPVQARTAAQPRAEALNPDSWLTPADVLRGVEHFDRRFDELRRDLAQTIPSSLSSL